MKPKVFPRHERFSSLLVIGVSFEARGSNPMARVFFFFFALGRHFAWHCSAYGRDGDARLGARTMDGAHFFADGARFFPARWRRAKFHCWRSFFPDGGDRRWARNSERSWGDTKRRRAWLGAGTETRVAWLKGPAWVRSEVRCGRASVVGVLQLQLAARAEEGMPHACLECILEGHSRQVYLCLGSERQPLRKWYGCLNVT